MLANRTTTKNSVAAIRERKREERVQTLRSKAGLLLSHFDWCSLWLFVSMARGDWDAFSDGDVLAIGRERGGVLIDWRIRFSHAGWRMT